MVTTRDPLHTYRLAELVRDCVAERVARTAAGAPDRVVILTGEIPDDDCECGTLTVAIESEFLTEAFPEERDGSQVSDATPCGGGRAVIPLVVSMMRCSPDGAVTPEPPTPEELQTAARAAVEDAWQIRTGLKCCLGELARTNDPNTNGRWITDFLIGTTTYVGARGMCQGSETPVTLGIINACADCSDGTDS